MDPETSRRVYRNVPVESLRVRRLGLWGVTFILMVGLLLMTTCHSVFRLVEVRRLKASEQEAWERVHELRATMSAVGLHPDLGQERGAGEFESEKSNH